MIHGAGNEEAEGGVQQEQTQKPEMGLHKCCSKRRLWFLIQTHCPSWAFSTASLFGSLLHPHQLHLKSVSMSLCISGQILPTAPKSSMEQRAWSCQRIPLLLHGYGYLAAKSSTLLQSPLPLYPPPLPHSSTTPIARLIPFPAFPHTRTPGKPLPE